MIRSPEDIQSTDKKIRILIAGYPGIGKSTLGLSAPKALHIDIDFGIDRIEPQYRRPYIQPSSYEEVLGDLKLENLEDYDTLVFDTGGKLIDLMKPWAIKMDPKNGKRDGSLSLQGYGVVGREFVRLMDFCFYELGKHVVVIFHAVEDKDGENTRLRLMVEGQTKNNVWIPMDLGGFLEMVGNDRTLGLSNCERYYAKGTRGVNGVLKIPALVPGKPNDFLTKLFDQYNQKSAAEIEALKAQEAQYEKAMIEGRDIIGQISDAQSANNMSKAMAAVNHALTSKDELGAEWKEKIAALGLIFDKKTKLYTDPAAKGD
ncbi:MAG: ATP-binding protein [Clostridia bacterium]|nr:ATP-binding protein [Clostridia bacterium]